MNTLDEVEGIKAKLDLAKEHMNRMAYETMLAFYGIKDTPDGYEKWKERMAQQKDIVLSYCECCGQQIDREEL